MNGHCKKKSYFFVLKRIRKLCKLTIALPCILSAPAFAQNANLVIPSINFEKFLVQNIIKDNDKAPDNETNLVNATNNVLVQNVENNKTQNATSAGDNNRLIILHEAEGGAATNTQTPVVEQPVANAVSQATQQSPLSDIDKALLAFDKRQQDGPIQWVRSLQSLQDDIASGKSGALQLQPVLLTDIGKKLLSADISTWNEVDNVHALLFYLFNGGNPNIVESILRTVPEGVIPKSLMDGALAYAHNRTTLFIRAFPKLPNDELNLPLPLEVSLMLGTINGISELNPIEAMRRLDYVRISAPGTLFEEAAIRRQMRVAVMSNNINALGKLTRNYIDRFAKSPYANDFWREFSILIPQYEMQLDDEYLDSLVSYAPLIVQYIVHIQISRQALIETRMQRAHFSAERALILAQKLKVDDSAARLYFAASFVSSTSAQRAADVLDTIAIEKLPKRDQPLLIAAKMIAQDVISDNSSWPFPIIQDNTTSDPLDMLALLPEEMAQKPSILHSPSTGGDNDVPMQTRAKTYADVIDSFMQDTQNKIKNIDELLEIGR